MSSVAKIARIEIDEDACKGCELCIEACFMDVLRWDGEREKPVVAYPEDCKLCLFCEDEPPTAHQPGSSLKSSMGSAMPSRIDSRIHGIEIK